MFIFNGKSHCCNGTLFIAASKEHLATKKQVIVRRLESVFHGSWNGYIDKSTGFHHVYFLIIETPTYTVKLVLVWDLHAMSPLNPI